MKAYLGLVLILLNLNLGFSFLGGDGSKLNPYLIGDCVDLQNVSFNNKANYSLSNDIDCLVTKTWNNGAGFDPISIYNSTFNGNGFTISNLFINRSNESEIGLFSRVSIFSGEVKDFNLANINISGNKTVGGVVGWLINEAKVVNVKVVSGEITGNIFIGGIAGINEGTIENSSNSVQVVGGDYVGGLAGNSGGGNTEILNSYNAGKIIGKKYVGGLVGFEDTIIGGIKIDNSYNKGEIIGNDSVGGLKGLSFYGGTTNHSYSIGKINGNFKVGGLVGDYVGGDLQNSFTTANLNGSLQPNFGGIAGNISGGSISNVYWLNLSSNVNFSFGSGSASGIFIVNSENYFFNCSNQPLVLWDNSIWKCNNLGYPNLIWQENLIKSSSSNIFPIISIENLLGSMILIVLFLIFN